MNCEKPWNGKLSATLKIRGGARLTVWENEQEKAHWCNGRKAERWV